MQQVLTAIGAMRLLECFAPLFAYGLLIDEQAASQNLSDDELPSVHAERLAREKAAVIAARETDAVVVAADTIVVVDGDILGKPRDEADAALMLRRLSGRAHVVLTAVAVAREQTVVSGVESVDVTFRSLSDDEIGRYIATREPMDKAGAYGIQGFGATIVDRIDGDYFAVMGLALGRMVRLLASVGVDYRFGEIVARDVSARQ